ncbi:SwmB domain-containing protein [Candidatus Poriferisodalis sp.]|uniref:SwmB domain-containing protein n=1 Tax=Candidatus Poriferisodalis sp. TaxID=3101277 RepID=UPI003B02423D
MALAAALVAMALLPLVAAEPAQATTTTLVSNTQSTLSGSGSRSIVAQSFTTSAQGATLSEIEIVTIAGTGGTSLSLRENKTSSCTGALTSCPGALVATLRNPSNTTGTTVAFTAPEGVTLAANTTYWVTMNEGVSGLRRTHRLVLGNSQTGLSGWTIGNNSLTKSSDAASWGTRTQKLGMRLKGTPVVPELVSAEADGTKLAMKFSESLNTGSVPATTAFAVTVDGSARSVASGGVAITGKKVTLTLASAVTVGQAVTVSYTKPTGASAMPLENTANVEVETFGAQPVLNVTAPVITGMEIVSKPRTSDSGTFVYARGQPIVVAVTWNGPVTWDLSADNAGMRVRLQVGSGNKNAELVTDGATSGTAETLWFSYTPVTADTDTDGVAVVPNTTGNNKDKVVFLRNGATLKGSAGTDAADSNAGTLHAAGLSAQAGHTVKGSIAAAGNSAPVYDPDDDPNTEDDTDLGDKNAPTGTLVHTFGVLGDISDANKDNLRYSITAARPDALETHLLNEQGWFQVVHRGCVLEDLEPALERNEDDVFENDITLTAADPDGAKVTLRATLLTNWNCRELVSASVNGAALTLTFDGTVHDDLIASGAEEQFEVAVDGTTAALAQTSPVSRSDSSLVLTLAQAVTRNQEVTVSFAPVVAEARPFTDQPVVNALNTVPTAAAMNANTMTVTFNRNVSIETGGDAADLARAFSASGVHWHADTDGDGIADGGVPLRRVAPESASVSGNTVTLTFGSDISPGRHATVDYYSGIAQTLEAGLLDADSLRVPSVYEQVVTATLAATVPPRLVSGQVAGTELTLTFDADLDSASAPAGSRFSVQTASGPISGTGTATVSGKTVTVTLASAVAERQRAAVWYWQGTDANPLRGDTVSHPLGGDSPGPEVDDIWDTVITTLDRTRPTIVTSALAGTAFVIYLSEKLDTSLTLAASDFTVFNGTSNSSMSLTGVKMSDEAVILTLASAPGDSDPVAFGYGPTQNSVRVADLAGNTLLSRTLSANGVTNAGATDPGPPSLVSSPPVVDPLVLTLTFDTWLDPAHVPAADTFTLGGTDPTTGVDYGDSHRITDIAVRGKKLELTVSPGFLACDDGLTVSYDPAAENALRNLWGTDANAFSDQAVTIQSSAKCAGVGVTPRVEPGPSGNSGPGGNSGADALSLGFKRSMRRSPVPSPDGFSVRSQTPGGAAAPPVEVKSVKFSDDGTQLQMALSRRLNPGEQVTASYRHPRAAPGLVDSDGNQIAAFSVSTVVPAPAPTVTGVEVVSDAGADDTYAMGETISVRVTFSDAVDVTGTPTLGIDMDPAHWGRKDAVYAGGSGTAELTFTHEVIRPNYSSQGIAVLADTLAHAGGAIRSASSQTDAALTHTGLGHDPAHKVDWRQSPPDVDGNRPPVFTGTSDTHNNALPGTFVSLAVSKDDFSDPDRDALTFTLSASRDDVYGPQGYGYLEGYGRIWFRAKTACALAELDPPTGGAYDTVITLTATDPEGATASATATFRTDPATYACPTLSAAAVDGDTLTITLAADGKLPPSYDPPTADQFEVKVDDTEVSLADTDAVSAAGTTIVLTLASPVTAGQAVTVSYIHGDDPMAAAFTDQSVTNNTPVPEVPEVPEKLEELEEPEVDPPAGGPTAPISAAVSGNELTLTFNRDLGAINAAQARALRWAFLVDGAYDGHGTAVNSQSPSGVSVDGNAVTLTLGTAIASGNDATVRYYSNAAANALRGTDGNPVVDFTATLTTTQRD